MAQAGCRVVARVWVRGVSVTACQTSPPAGSDVSAERGASGAMCGFGPRTGQVDLPSPRLGRPRKARLWVGGGPLDVPVGCVRRRVVGCVVAELLGEAGNRTQPLSLQLFLRAWNLDMPSYRA